ncbi:MAG: translation initiation factor IF-2 [Candidatus Obscuribacterales bacterium]|nr:translation initiation factor IF-2 [Candidatus Obscuribacterales bacterium]
MDDRVRVYELARKMNLSNQEVITGFRELGFDVKSHSSTVDGNAVGLFIAHLGKKKAAGKEDEKPKSKPSVAKPVPPPPPAVKPRVLSRYRPTPPGGAEPAAADQASVAGGAPRPVTPLGPGQIQSKPIGPSHRIAGEIPANPSQVVPSTTTAPVNEAQGATENVAAIESVLEPKPSIGEVVENAVETPSGPPPVEEIPAAPVLEVAATAVEPDAESPEVVVADAETRVAPTEGGEPGKSFEEPKLEEKDEPNEPRAKPNSQGVRPMTPSVPVRVAAPSFRATPPRPPKHRQGPSDRHKNQRGGGSSSDDRKQAAGAAEVPKVVALTGPLTVKELSERMTVAVEEIIKRLFMKGFMRTVNQVVELELARDLATEMGYEVPSREELQLAQDVEDQADKDKLEAVVMTDAEIASLMPRPPVVTIMGHVDHGKTSLLDAIRQTKFLLTDQEAGGITQHIGAYHVEVSGEDGQMRQVVFLDTPGHEAFTAMRARGAKATDIAILVVAADDGVMPQTIEAIDHAKAAGVPIIVAVNKVDKAGSDPDRVLTQLMEHGLLPDKFGGETVTVNVSAKKKTGLDELLEMILLVADMQDLKANPDRSAIGTIIEAELHRGKGPVATALVQNGTLRVGDIIVAGSVYGRVRNLHDDHGRPVRAAGPSMPVEVLGLPEVPLSGDKFEVVEDLQKAKQIAEERKIAEQERRSHRVTLESLHDLVEQGEVQDLCVIVKADVLGTAEAIGDQLRKLSTKEVNVRVLRTASGDISENDVNLAASSNAIVIGFNVSPDTNAERAAENAGVDVKTYSVIYQIIDNLQLAIQGLLQPIKQEMHIGTAEVRQLFKLGKHQVIAGCYVTSGKITRGSLVRISRGTTQIYEGKIETLRRFKDDVKEVATGFECGMSFEKFHDLQEGDVINAHIIQEVKREAVAK